MSSLKNDKDRPFWIGVLIITLICAAFRLYNLSIRTYDWDEGDYALSSYYLYKGLVPYKDFQCTQPPLLFYLVALSFKIFGVGLWQAKLPGAICGILTAPLLIFIAKRMGCGNWSLLAGFAWTVSLPAIENSRTVMMDVPVTFFTTLAVYFYIRGNYKLSGTALSIAVLTKLAAAPLFFVFLLHQLFFIQKRDLRKSFNWLKKFFLGALPLIILILVYAFYVGFYKFIDYTVFYHMAKESQSWSYRYSLFRKIMKAYFFLFLFFFLNALFFLIYSDWRKIIPATGKFLYLWFIILFLFIFVQKRPYSQHFILILPPLCVFFSVFFKRLDTIIQSYTSSSSIQKIRFSHKNRALFLSATFLIFTSIVIIGLAAPSTIERSDSFYEDRLIVQRKIANFLIANITPGQKVLSDLPIVNFLAKIEMPDNIVDISWGSIELTDYLTAEMLISAMKNNDVPYVIAEPDHTFAYLVEFHNYLQDHGINIASELGEDVKNSGIEIWYIQKNP
ncbi:MAG: ArnT family glycosyltransferase [Candidatus Wukongarchaeota archaeon]|nr:glycosyltransferase family 39 protein [Candidatus Wukongarchaeota archaeon]